MNNLQLQRTLRLLRRTGDRGIVLDSESDEVFVLMDADAYEKMLPTNNPFDGEKGGGEEGLDDYVLDDLLEIVEKQSSTPELIKNEPAEQRPVQKPSVKTAQTEKKLDFADNWPVEKNPIISEESLADVPHEEEEEEKFYLEPVE